MEDDKSYFDELKNFITEENDDQDDIEENIDLDEIDYSDASGGFKKSLRRITKRAVKKRKVQKRLSSKIIIPKGHSVKIENIDKALLSNSAEMESIRNIGYYQGKRLKEMVFTINNDGLVDFAVELFNPSAPLDYLYSTSLNLNDKIQVAGGGIVSYTDVLHNMLANPILIPNMRVVISGSNTSGQSPQPIIISNKSIEGSMTMKPANLNLHIDNMQVDANIVYFDMMKGIGRAYVPDGMDIMKYTVLAGNTVTFAFFYKQHQIKKFFFPETRTNKIL